MKETKQTQKQIIISDFGFIIEQREKKNNKDEDTEIKSKTMLFPFFMAQTPAREKVNA